MTLYTDIISLEDAKEYLGVDDTARDGEITRMIGSALQFVEKHSNHILKTKTQKYYYRNGCRLVYDYPIQSVVFPSPDTTTATVSDSFVEYTDSNGDNDYVELTVGYTSCEDVPPSLIEAGYMMLEHLFYKREASGTVPLDVLILIRANARHTI